MSKWCERSWHDGDCCKGSREQWSNFPAYEADKDFDTDALPDEPGVWEVEPEPGQDEPRCYSPGLEHNRCQAGHPIHHDTTGRYEVDGWVHCTIADVVACPHDTEQILDVRPGKHRVTS